MDSIAERTLSRTGFWVTLVGFAPEEASHLEDALHRTADTLQIAVRCERGVSDTSYPAAVVHAIVLTPKAIAQAKEGDLDTIRFATNLGTCRVYLLDAAWPSGSPGGSPFDQFIQRTQAHGHTAVANEIITFFREADNLNRRETPLAFRDMTCLTAYRLLEYFWPLSYIFAALHILNVLTALAGHGAWLGGYAIDYVVPVSTFFGAFFIAHCSFVVFRNWLFALRITKKVSSSFALPAAGFGMAAVVTAYSIAVTDPSILRVSISAILSVAAYMFYIYARRIRGECASMSELQAALVDSQRREDVLRRIGVQPFGPSAFPLFAYRSRSLFISYMHGSKWSSDTAAQIQQWASNHGFEVFLDRSIIPSGSLWRRSLHRAISECRFFVAVIDGDAPITEWVLAESAYAALLRKSIGKPRILLVVQNAQRITEDKRNPIHLTYLDVFTLPPSRCLGAAILPVDAEHRLTERRFLQVLEEVQPMCLLLGKNGKSQPGVPAETPLRQEATQFSLDDFQVADRSWRMAVLLVMLLDAEGSGDRLRFLVHKGLEWMRSDDQEKKAIGLNTLRFLLRAKSLPWSRDLLDEVFGVFLADASLAVKLAALDLLGAMGTAPNPLNQVSECEARRISDYQASLMRLMNASQHAYASKGVHVDLARESSGRTHEAALLSLISRVDKINTSQA